MLQKDFRAANVYLPRGLADGGVFLSSYLTMLAYRYRLVDEGHFLIHAAALIDRGEGILFCGLSGAGKSTQANLWLRYVKDTSILNYDQPCVLHTPQGVLVHGSPWSGKEKVCLNRCAPLKAIVFVEQAKENEVRRLSTAEAFSLLYLNNYIYPFTRDIEQRYERVIRRTAELVPVYKLRCNISEGAVQTLYEALYSEPYIKRRTVMQYKVKDCFEMKQVAGDYIVIPRGSMSIDFGAVVVFNESGAFLWNELKQYASADDLAEKLAAHYGIEPDAARKDADAFLQKMDDSGLLDKREAME